MRVSRSVVWWDTLATLELTNILVWIRVYDGKGLLQKNEPDDGGDTAAVTRQNREWERMSDATTDNIPSQKIMATAILRWVGICRREMTGIGKHKTTMSNPRFVPTCAKPNAVVS